VHSEKAGEEHLQWSVVGTNLLEAYRRVFDAFVQVASAVSETESRSVSRAQL